MADAQPANSERPSKRVRLSSPNEEGDVFSSAHPTIGDADHPGNEVLVTASEETFKGGDAELDKEVRAGIRVFVNPRTSGFSGVLKQRYTDFLVNEILPNGQVLHLENLAPPSRQQIELRNTQTETLADAVKEPPEEAVTQSLPVSDGKVDDNESVNAPAEAVVGEQVVESNGSTLKPEDQSALSAIFGESITSAIGELDEQVRKHPGRKPRDFKPVTSKVITDKDERKAAHQEIRRIFSSRLETFTSEDGAIVVKPAPLPVKGARWSRDRNAPPRGKGRLGWDELGGEYLHFTLYKENKDTMEVVYYIASQLKMNTKSFQFAGTKDRRAVTVQRVSVYRVYADRMAQVGRSLRNAKIGDYEYKTYPLELGDLTGNEFVITLRDCHFPGEEGLEPQQKIELANATVAEAVSTFSKDGFLNYYGLQRFGSFTTSTDTIGLKLLQGNLAGAIDDILSYSPAALTAAQAHNTEFMISSDDKARAEALHMWRTTKNAGAALDKLPRKFSAEISIIRHLGSRDRRTGKHNKEADYQGALNSMPRNLRLMYVHAYQSLVWNVVASRRWERFGNQVVEGDLVIASNDRQNGKQSDDQEVDEQGEPIIKPELTDSATDTAATDQFTRARPLSAEEAQSGKYTIFDIVLPLPGYDVEYPKNEIGAYYKDFMSSEQGGGLDPHDMRRTWKDISLSGGYRKVMARPENVDWEVRTYAHDEVQLVETDAEKLEKRGVRGVQRDGNGEVHMGDRQKSTNGDDNGKALVDNGEPQDASANEEKRKEEKQEEEKIAVILKMQLGSSQYATMALRELMKEGGLKTFKPDYGGGR